jgi:protease PrsW
VTTLVDGVPVADLRRRSPARTAIVGVVALFTVAALCGWAIYLDLNGLIGRTALVYALLFAFVPVVPLAAAFLWLDRMRPEPSLLLVVALVWGALAATYLSLQVNGCSPNRSATPTVRARAAACSSRPG